MHLEDAQPQRRTPGAAGRLVLCVAALMLSCFPACVQARAGQAECMWQHIPPEVRRTAAANYENGGKAALESLAVTDDLVEAAMKACGARASSPEAAHSVSGSLVGAALKDAAGRWLALRGVSPRKLSSAWLRTSRADRRTIWQELSTVSSDAVLHSGGIWHYFLAFARRTGAAPPGAWPRTPNRQYDALLDYFEGQVELEGYERGY